MPGAARQSAFRVLRPMRGQEGLALPIAMVVTFLVLVIGLALTETSRMDAMRSVADIQALQAQAAAELGLARAKAMALSQKAPWAVMRYNGTYLTFVDSRDPLYNGHEVCYLFTDVPVGGNVNATYSVVIEDLTGWLVTSGTYRIHAFGTAGPYTRHVTTDAQTITYASFGWLTDSENGIYFGTGDVVDGWVYTNDQINIWGNPVFTGKVNSAASSLNYGHGGPPQDNPVFQQGLFLNSTPLNMAALMNGGHNTAIRNKALEPTGIWFGSNSGRPYSVEFASNGTVTIKKKRPNGSWQTVLNQKALSTTNGAIYIEETVQVKGTLNGQVTLATPQDKDIEIVDNLVYAYPPNPSQVFEEGFNPETPSFDDKLGLIAGRDIVVKKDWSGSWTNMYIMASVLAVTGKFRNEYYTSFPGKTLHLYGGIAQDTRGPVGLTSGAGFTKDYKYDQRFMTQPPPHFPTVTYDFSAWVLDP